MLRILTVRAYEHKSRNEIYINHVFQIDDSVAVSVNPLSRALLKEHTSPYIFSS